MARHEEVKEGVIFPIGQKNNTSPPYFAGRSYPEGLVADPQVNVAVGNIDFEPGYRNNGHVREMDCCRWRARQQPAKSFIPFS